MAALLKNENSSEGVERWSIYVQFLLPEGSEWHLEKKFWLKKVNPSIKHKPWNMGKNKIC